MLGSLGLPELILIFVVALIVFGPRRLPEIGRSLGKGLAEFKKASEELKQSIRKEVDGMEQPSKSETTPARTDPSSTTGTDKTL